VDAVIAAMPPNSWKELPDTQMKDVCPLPYSTYWCQNVIAAWSGGAYDEARERMVVYGGGHGDSWYNNMFAFDLVSMKWHRLSEMALGATGAVPAPGWNDLRLESCGFYPKGPVTLPDDVMRGAYVAHEKCFVEPVLSQLDLQQPRSAHTYGEVFVDRLSGRYCYLGAGAYFPSAQTTTQVAVCFDPATTRWSRLADRPRLVGGYGQTALDSTGKVWSFTANGGYIAEYDPVANTWRTFGYVNWEAGGSTDIDRRRNHAHVLYPRLDAQSTPLGYTLRRFDLTSPASLNAQRTYTDLPVTGDVPGNLGPRPGFAYADARDRFYAWGGGRTVYSLNPANQVWTRLEATGDDPGVQQRWGTFGRFRYSPSRGVFVLVNDTRHNVFIYKPAQ
jgi:hypothetical protein